jgi:hypothetical protein
MHASWHLLTHRFSSVLLYDTLNACGYPQVAAAGVGYVKCATQGVDDLLNWLVDLQLHVE